MVSCFARTYYILRNALGLVLDLIDCTPANTNQELINGVLEDSEAV